VKRRGFALALAFLAAANAARAAGMDDLEVRGHLDLVAASRGPAFALNTYNRGDSPFDAYRLRLFVEGPVADGVEVYTQLLFHDDLGASVLGAYGMWTPWAERDHHLIAGKIPWRIGTYAERTYSDRNPLIGTPLIYQYHTSLRADRLPPNADALANAAGTGQFGPVYDAAGRGFRGMPIVYDRCWDFGVMLTGSARPFEYSAGYVNGTPSAATPGNDRNNGKSWLGRAGLQPWPGVRMGISGSFGPWLSDAFASQMPAGHTVNDYAQQLVMADAEWLVSRLELRAEGLWNVWETPYAGDAEMRGASVEARIGLPSGAFAAGRWNVLRFGDVIDSTGAARGWDLDVARIEAGLGYRLQRGVIVKAVYQRTMFLRDSDVEESLYAVQAAIAF
jgi:hypothetical protein